MKQLLQRQSALDAEIVQLERRVTAVAKLGDELIADGHHDAPAIKRACDELVDRFNRLREPLATRHAHLDESLRLHQWAFDAGKSILLLTSVFNFIAYHLAFTFNMNSYD